MDDIDYGAVDRLPDTGTVKNQAAEGVGNAEMRTTSDATLTDGKTMQNVSYFGNLETIKGKGNGGTQTCEYPNKYRGMAVNDKWQGVADAKSTIFTVTVYSGGFRIRYPPTLQ